MSNTRSRISRFPRALFLFLLASIPATGAFAGSADPPPLPVLVGLYQNPPKIFTNPSGTPSGILVDLLGEIAREENWSLRYVPGEWTDCLRALEKGRIDLMPDVAHSQERAALYDFHRVPALVSWSQLYARPGLEVTGLSDLNGRKIAILEGAIQKTTLLRMLNGFGFQATLVPTGSLEEAFRMAARGQADVAVANHYFGDYSFRKYGLTKTAVVFEPSSLFYVTTRGRHADLLEAVDRHLKAWKDDPDSPYYRVLARWMAPPPERSVPKHLAWLIVLVAGALVLATGMILLLRHQVRTRTRYLEQANLRLQENIAELERTKEALANQGAMLEAQANSTRDGILVVDERGKIVFQNRRMLEIWGIPAAVADTGDDQEQIRHVMDSTLDPTGFVAQIEHLYHHPEETRSDEIEMKDGRILDRFSAPVRGPGGKHYGRIWTFRDITESKRASERLKKTLEELQHTNAKLIELGRVKDDFLATVSHELRTPLTSIIGFLKLLGKHGRTLPENEYHAFVDTATRNGERLAELVNNLLDLQARNPALETVVRTPCAARELVARAWEPLKVLAEQRGIDIDPTGIEDRLMVQADAPKLERVLLNLFSNALKYSPAGGKITVSAGPETRDGQAGVVFRVHNGGECIPVDKLGKIFEEFFQVDNTTTRRVGGTGLGLSICRRIIEAHGGRIWAESAEGHGVTILFFLPGP